MALPANTSNKAATETYEYDRALSGGVTNLNGAAVAGRGLVTKITHTAPESKYLQFKYDAYGNKVWEDNELGKITQYTYDDYNRLLSATDPLSNTTRYDYAPTQGNTTQAQQHTSNSPYWITMPTGILTHNIYDENWRKTSATAASGTLNLTTSFIYDPVGNLTDVTDPRGKVTHNVYDNRNRKTSTTEAYGTNIAATTVWHYDAASNINQIDRPDGIHETKVFDALNRMISHTVPRQVPGPSPTPAPINLITHYYYNPAGTIDHVTDPRGKVTSFQYNPSDEKTRMTYHDGSYQQWVWDNAHNLASRTTVNGETQSFTYDNRNRKTGMSWSNNADSATFTYYDDGRLNIASNPNSTVTRSYDDAGHLTLDQQNVTGLSSAKSVNYPSYDGDGRLLQMNVAPTPSPAYNYTYGYDGAGRLTTITPTGGSVLFRYAYDASSNETDRYAYLPNSVTIDQIYARDSLDRMASRLVKKGTATFSTEAYTYDHMNRITEVNRGGVADDFGFYWDGELLSAQYGGGPHSPYQEGQDPDLDTTDNIDPNAGYQPPDQEAPEPTAPPDDYSDLPVGGFVPPALPGGRSVTYYVDRAGNRQQVTDSSNPTATYAANNINQYSSVSGCSITNGLEHEVSSFQGPTDPGAVTYTYINDEHLKQVSDTSGNTYYLYYDALGRCVKRTLIIPAPASINTTTTTTYYIYDGDKPIVEYSSTGIVGRNVYGKGIDEVLMRTDPGVNGGNAFYYAHDHEGSVTHLLDGRSTPSSQTGNVIEQYKYDAFGAPTFYDVNNTQINSTAYDNRFLFTGREYAASYPGTYVPAFTFYEYRARAYNPTLGRFVSEDPKLFDAGDYNLFRYCHNDPIDFGDAMGLEENYAQTGAPVSGNHVAQAIDMDDRAYNFIMGLMQRQFNSAISAGMAGYNAWSALSKGLASLMKGQAADPAHIRVIRSSNDRYGAMLGEMWHTDDRGNIIGGVDAFLANTETNTPADNPSRGFYSTGGPLPPGNYVIRPKEAWQVEKGDKYPAGQPAITSRGLAPGKINAPGGQIRSALFIHGYGTSNGCLAVPDYALRNVFGAMSAGPVYLNLREEAVPHY
jgi:RHS repeat-associated protein